MSGSKEELEATYKLLHDNLQTVDMRDVHYFLRRRVQAAFSFSVQKEIMEWRHRSVYARIFNMELIGPSSPSQKYFEGIHFSSPGHFSFPMA